MIKTDLIISLIRSHVNGDDTQFRRIAMQMSAAEAKAGHSLVASSIHEAINSAIRIQPLKFKSLNAEMTDLLMIADKRYSMKDMVVSFDIKNKIDRVLKEYIAQDKLHKYNLENRRKLLLYGVSGTGKTMTAEILAHELNLPFIIVRTEKVVTKFMGETGLKLGKIFDTIASIPAVYLFDEFDAIGAQRGMDNEVGEQRRILNTFLQLLERDSSSSIIIAATNNVEVLDKALFRRFDDAIEYTLPERNEIISLLKEALCMSKEVDVYSLCDDFEGMSQAEIKIVCADAMKEGILAGNDITNDMIRSLIKQRKSLNIKIG
ncbi:MAG: ATP-binding protein [Prevotella sp.]